MRNLSSVLVEEVWRRHFVAYEGMLASFSALQDSTEIERKQATIDLDGVSFDSINHQQGRGNYP
jgi:hypothetical protein